MYENKKPQDVREIIRKGLYNGNTSGMCGGYVQANLVILPADEADVFRRFAMKNPKACPILEELPAGVYQTETSAKDADIRTDVPQYKVFEHGQFTAYVDAIENYWQDDFVTFLLGCSFSFENAFLEEAIPVRHIEQGRNVPMYITNIPCEPAGRFSGTMVVSMRPIPKELVPKAVEISARYPLAHGEPIHVGSPEVIGIADLSKPDFGDAVELQEGDVPIFWPCGVTPQNAALQAKPSLMITHAPGHMFITDLRDEEIRE